jgi:arabinan endo-1,5-alpha-L-arabinosidase
MRGDSRVGFGRGLAATLVVAASLGVGVSAASAYPYPGLVAGETKVHDPSLLIRSSYPRYTVYSTGNQALIGDDRVNFTGPLPSMIPAAWWTLDFNAENAPWAPDVSFHNGQYWMYYSVSRFGVNKSAIGLATSATGDPGTWIDQGEILRSNPGDRYNAIDPNLLVDAQGQWWLSFGSFWDGLFMLRLNSSTGKPSSYAFTHIAARPGGHDAIEAPSIFRRGGYYYLFASYDRCCAGSSSTYNIRVGRSTSPTGPYLDRAGTRMLDGGGSMVLESHDWVRGPGGQNVVYDSKDNKDLLVYHYYDSRAGGQSFLGINWIGWDTQGWPYVW